jgi:hypothetical protein
MIAFYLQKRQYSRVAGNQGSPKEGAIPFPYACRTVSR